MNDATIRRVLLGLAAAIVLLVPRSASAQIPLGTWLRTDLPPAQAMTMTVEACCNGGRRLTYRMATTKQVLLSVDSPLDGTETPVVMAGGKPTGETMAIKFIDRLHYTATMKMNGKPMGNSKATFSADLGTLTVESDMVDSGGQKVTEKWTKQN